MTLKEFKQLTKDLPEDTEIISCGGSNPNFFTNVNMVIIPVVKLDDRWFEYHENGRKTIEVII